MPFETIKGLESASHLWVLFWMHIQPDRYRRASSETQAKNEKKTQQPTQAFENWKPTVRPPRQGGNQKIGVFASRSPFRPNPIGLSAVRLIRSEGLKLWLSGGDFVDGTPVLDLKPYLPYADCIPEAECKWASGPPREKKVTFAADLDSKIDPQLQKELIELLRFDPRPAYLNDPQREHFVAYRDFEIAFTADDNTIVVRRIQTYPSSANS